MNRSRSGAPSSVGPNAYGPADRACGNWNCTCDTPVIAPGRLKVLVGTGESSALKAASPGVSGIGGAVAISPVARAGVTGPKPLTKTVTTEPAIAGLAQSFKEPSAFIASAATPNVNTPPHKVDSGNTLPTAAGVR